MKKRHRRFNSFKSMATLVGVFALVFLVYKTSSSLISNSLTERFKIDKITGSYLSFNYADDDSVFYEIDNPMVTSDFYGKSLSSHYDFEVSMPKESINSDIVEYKIIVKDMINKVDSKFVKIYLTDQNNKPVEGFKNVVPVYTVFNDGVDGKVIYSGTLSRDDTSDKYRLKIWISSAYGEKLNDNLAYQIRIEKK